MVVVEVVLVVGVLKAVSTKAGFLSTILTYVVLIDVVVVVVTAYATVGGP